MTTTFQRNMTQQFMVVSCYTCGVPFGITSQMYRRVVTDAEGSVYCPACGNKTCWRESEHDREKKRLQREIESANRKADTARRRAENEERMREETANKLRATKGVVTRMKNRASKGICPCCNRSFQNLRRHMESQHPDYASTES